MRVAFLGDSITLGYGLDRPEDRYSTLVCRELEAEEENYGITGTLIAPAGLNRTDRKDYVSRVELIADADLAVVFGGTNDYFWSDAPIYGAGGGEDRFENALHSILRRIGEMREGRITLFVTPYPHNGVGNYWGGAHGKDSNRHDTDARNFNGHTLEDYVVSIENACRTYNVPCLNLFREISFDWRKHTLDGCHPNPEGHALLAEAVTKKLRALMRGQ